LLNKDKSNSNVLLLSAWNKGKNKEIEMERRQLIPEKTMELETVHVSLSWHVIKLRRRTESGRKLYSLPLSCLHCPGWVLRVAPNSFHFGINVYF
jgi:hypothetical protein